MKFIKYTDKYLNKSVNEGMQTSMGDNPAGEEFNMSPSTNHVSQQTDLKQVNPDYQDEDDEDRWNPSIINKDTAKSGNVTFIGKKKTPGGGIDSFGNRKNRYYTDFATVEGFEEFRNLHQIDEGLSKSAIKKQIKLIDKMIDDETGGDGEPLTSETLQDLERERERLEKLIESVNEASTRHWMKFLKDNTKQAKNDPKSFVKDAYDKGFPEKEILAGLIDVGHDEEDADDYYYNIVGQYESVNESTIGIKTEGSFKPKDLSDALDKAKVKFNMNRLSMTLTVLKLDKKYFDAAQRVVDDLGLNIMMAKESVNEDSSNYSLLDFFKEMQSFPAAGVDRDDIKDASKPKNKKKTVKNTPKLQSILDDWMSGRYDEDPGYLVDELRSLLESESVNEGSREDVEDMHFETDPKKLQQRIITLGKSMGALHNKEAKEFGEYSLHKYRKEIGYASKPDKKYKVDRDKEGYQMSIDAFTPGSYSAAKSKLGDGPHRKARAKVKWNQKKYDQWIEDVSSGGGYNHAHDMAQNAKQEQGLIDWVKKNIVYDEDPMDRIQWDIEAQTP